MTFYCVGNPKSKAPISMVYICTSEFYTTITMKILNLYWIIQRDFHEVLLCGNSLIMQVNFNKTMKSKLYVFIPMYISVHIDICIGSHETIGKNHTPDCQCRLAEEQEWNLLVDGGWKRWAKDKGTWEDR